MRSSTQRQACSSASRAWRPGRWPATPGCGATTVRPGLIDPSTRASWRDAVRSRGASLPGRFARLPRREVRAAGWVSAIQQCARSSIVDLPSTRPLEATRGVGRPALAHRDPSFGQRRICQEAPVAQRAGKATSLRPRTCGLRIDPAWNAAFDEIPRRHQIASSSRRRCAEVRRLQRQPPRATEQAQDPHRCHRGYRAAVP